MPAGATSNMKREVLNGTLDRVAVWQRADVRNLLSLLLRGKCFFLTSFYRTPLCCRGNRGGHSSPGNSQSRCCPCVLPVSSDAKEEQGRKENSHVDNQQTTGDGETLARARK